MNNIKQFLRSCAAELFTSLQDRRRRKQASNGRHVSRSASVQVNIIFRNLNVTHTSNCAQSSAATHISHYHDNDNVTDTSVIHSTTNTRNRRRRLKRSNRNRYWRYNNHNIYLDTSAVINLSNINLTGDETQLLAWGLSFCPTPRHVNWTEVKADFSEFSRRMRLL